jgi:adenylate cyclase
MLAMPPGVLSLFAKHWRRIAVTLIPVLLALMHAIGGLHISALEHLDQIFYDTRLRATMPQTLDERIVIVDLDEKSLAEVGRWPWGRNKMAQLVNTLFEQQKIAVLGFDVVFAEADESSGLARLQALAANELKDQPAVVERVRQLTPELDFDAQFARALQGRPVVLGYYFTGEDRERVLSGQLPAPVLERAALQGRYTTIPQWTGYGTNIEALSRAAPMEGFFNVIPDSDGVVRSLPLLSGHQGQYYESLSLAMYRILLGGPQVELGFANDKAADLGQQPLERVVLRKGNATMSIPTDTSAAVRVPYRGEGGAQGNSFRYISAADILAKRLPMESLKGKIVLVGTTAPGLLDLRVTPVGKVYPGVETHANVLSGFLDDHIPRVPDYTVGYEVVVVVLAGLVLALGLPLMSAWRAVALSAGMVLVLVGLNVWLFVAEGLVMPLASAVMMTLLAFGLNMFYGYFVESRSKRELAHLFGTYVPPELVDEMVKAPDSYSMQAMNRELTVMFCDMRGFTKMSERMEPTQLQAMLTGVFSRLTAIIRANRGTIDKYMGDCVMAFWGAPVQTPEHAYLAVKAAREMSEAIRTLNAEHRAQGLPEIGIGIGLNTGTMCVGDMGSDIRRSYTVVGDAVNLGSRLEGLSKTYGVDMVVSESTRKQAPQFAWQELDCVRVKGKDQAVSIFWPVAEQAQLSASSADELKMWGTFLKAYRAQNWDQADVALLNLSRMAQGKYIYQLYAQRVASMRVLPFDPTWDGATNFDTK